MQDVGTSMREGRGRDETIGQDARRQTGQHCLRAGVATRLKEEVREGQQGPPLAWP